MKKQLTAGQAKARGRVTYISRPGIISTIIDVLKKAGEKGKPVGVEQILTKLQRKFPERDLEGMEITVRAQLSRLPKEKKLNIEKTREGRNVFYQAA